ncbi:MAG: CoA ester lyase [Actinomycetia bacterium]|nr:CoA ester lyase [Actinomycetes bacterium]
MKPPDRSHEPSAARSFLYVPGDNQGMLARALERDADAVIVDLEDGVRQADKEAARKITATWIADNHGTSTDIWVRVNPSDELLGSDLDAVVGPGLRGVYLPKAASSASIELVSDALTDLETSRGLPPNSIHIAPLLETASSILEIPAIASASRVSHLALGETDLAADLKMHPSLDGRELNPIRMAVVVASAARCLKRPIAPVLTSFQDLEALRSTSMMFRRMGYAGRAAIHPTQIKVINDAFSPSNTEIESARDILARFERAQAIGDAVTVAEDGSLIDEAVVRRARVTLDTARPGRSS